MTSKHAEKTMGVAIKLMHTGLVMYAQAYNTWAKDTLDDPEYKLGNDGVLGQAWKDMAKEYLTLLGGVSNLDRTDGLRAMFASIEVLWSFLDRPVFRGAPLNWCGKETTCGNESFDRSFSLG